MLKLGMLLNQNASLIFGGLALGSFVATIAFTMKGQMKADHILAERNNYFNEIKVRREFVEKEDENGEIVAEEVVNEENEDTDKAEVINPPTFKERMALTWKCYIPAAICAVMTIASVAAGSYISWKTIAGLSGTVSVLVAQRDELEKAARAKFGDEAVDELKQKVSSDIFGRYNKEGKDGEDSKKSVEVRYVDAEDTGLGSLLCYDWYSGKKFLSSYDAVKKGIDDFNEGLLSYEYAGYDELYTLWGLKPNDFTRSRGWFYVKDANGDLLDSNCSEGVTAGVYIKLTMTKYEDTDTDMLLIEIMDEPYEGYYEY